MNSGRAPTVRQIAQAADLSIATVSLALRNHPKVPPATRRRIQEVARKLGYRPNPLVSALMAHVRTTSPARTLSTLAFINAFPTREFHKVSPGFDRYYEGASRRAAELGYHMEGFWAKEPGMTARRLTSILDARGIYGILVGPLPQGRGHLSLDWSKFAACSLGYSMWRPHLHRAVSHHVHAMFLAIRRLKRQGYQRIGLAMSANCNERVDYLWLSSFFYYQHTIAAKHRVPVLVDESPRLPRFPKWLRAHDPEVVICPHYEAFDWLVKLQIQVPGEMGFVHLDVDKKVVTFSGINQRTELIGAAGVELLVDQINRNERGIPENPKLVSIEPEWYDGQTTRDLKPGTYRIALRVG